MMFLEKWQAFEEPKHRKVEKILCQHSYFKWALIGSSHHPFSSTVAPDGDLKHGGKACSYCQCRPLLS